MVIPREDDRMPGSDDLGLEDLVEFTDNPEPRCACVLLLDTSGSMYGPPIRALNDGIRAFKDELEGDPLASLRVETAIVSFDSSVQLVQDFATVDSLATPTLDAQGTTSTATAVNFAIDRVEERKQSYRDAGIPYYRPWIVLITDGASTESRPDMNAASERVRQAEEAKQLAFFSVGVQGADMEELNSMGTRGALPLDGLAFREFFVWLSGSMTRVSSSRVDDEIDLPDVSGWAKL